MDAVGCVSSLYSLIPTLLGNPLLSFEWSEIKLLSYIRNPIRQQRTGSVRSYPFDLAQSVEMFTWLVESSRYGRWRKDRVRIVSYNRVKIGSWGLTVRWMQSASASYMAPTTAYVDLAFLWSCRCDAVVAPLPRRFSLHVWLYYPQLK